MTAEVEGRLVDEASKKDERSKTLAAFCVMAVLWAALTAGCIVLASAQGASLLWEDRPQIKAFVAAMCGDEAAQKVFGSDECTVVGVRIDKRGRETLEVKPDGWAWNASMPVKVSGDVFQRARVGDRFDLSSMGLEPAEG